VTPGGVQVSPEDILSKLLVDSGWTPGGVHQDRGLSVKCSYKGLSATILYVPFTNTFNLSAIPFDLDFVLFYFYFIFYITIECASCLWLKVANGMHL
jgi:hypothetical protein